jgi:hypothetical protein
LTNPAQLRRQAVVTRRGELWGVYYLHAVDSETTDWLRQRFPRALAAVERVLQRPGVKEARQRFLTTEDDLSPADSHPYWRDDARREESRAFGIPTAFGARFGWGEGFAVSDVWQAELAGFGQGRGRRAAQRWPKEYDPEAFRRQVKADIWQMARGLLAVARQEKQEAFASLVGLEEALKGLPAGTRMTSLGVLQRTLRRLPSRVAEQVQEAETLEWFLQRQDVLFGEGLAGLPLEELEEEESAFFQRGRAKRLKKSSAQRRQDREFQETLRYERGGGSEEEELLPSSYQQMALTKSFRVRIDEAASRGELEGIFDELHEFLDPVGGVEVLRKNKFVAGTGGSELLDLWKRKWQTLAPGVEV